ELIAVSKSDYELVQGFRHEASVKEHYGRADDHEDCAKQTVDKFGNYDDHHINGALGRVLLLSLWLRDLSALRGDHLPATLTFCENISESLHHAYIFALVGSCKDRTSRYDCKSPKSAHVQVVYRPGFNLTIAGG